MLIPISNRECEYFEIDDEDYDLISKYTWYVNRRYLTTNIGGKKTLLHRLLLGLVTGNGKVVDHQDGNPLNNRRDNLRLCTQQQNVRNSRKKSKNKSGFKGVIRYHNKWLAQIHSDGCRMMLGQYDSIIEAAKAYDRAASELHKEFSKLNFDESSEHFYKKDTVSSFNFYETKKTNKTSPFHGVSLHKNSGKWIAKICKHIGLFKTEQEAALAVDGYIIKNNLDKSKLNFPKGIGIETYEQ
jgi:hypothetical protein